MKFFGFRNRKESKKKQFKTPFGLLRSGEPKLVQFEYFKATELQIFQFRLTNVHLPMTTFYLAA